MVIIWQAIPYSQSPTCFVYYLLVLSFCNGWGKPYVLMQRNYHRPCKGVQLKKTLFIRKKDKFHNNNNKSLLFKYDDCPFLKLVERSCRLTANEDMTFFRRRCSCLEEFLLWRPILWIEPWHWWNIYHKQTNKQKS